MLVETPSWTSSDNKTHSNYLTGLKHELSLIFAKSGDTDVVARKIVDALTLESIEEVVRCMLLIKGEMERPSRFVMTQVENDSEGTDHLVRYENLNPIGSSGDGSGVSPPVVVFEDPSHRQDLGGASPGC